ncbi:ABC transporter permease, partial [Streptomyces sp. BE282]|nr:ABC transporter permease [Streptomyces sp. BE282]
LAAVTVAATRYAGHKLRAQKQAGEE